MNPKWDEVFGFKVSGLELQELTLHFKVRLS